MNTQELQQLIMELGLDPNDQQLQKLLMQILESKPQVEISQGFKEQLRTQLVQQTTVAKAGATNSLSRHAEQTTNSSSRHAEQTTNSSFRHAEQTTNSSSRHAERSEASLARGGESAPSATTLAQALVASKRSFASLRMTERARGN